MDTNYASSDKLAADGIFGSMIDHSTKEGIDYSSDYDRKPCGRSNCIQNLLGL